jgi:2,3-dihydroxybenzoate decarboxylase
MKGKIALEEHWSLPETLDDSRGFVGGSADWSRFERQILELGDERVSEMEKNGIDHQIVSLNAPSVQAVVSTNEAIDLAHRANNTMAILVNKNRKRFSGFAALPMQDPTAAANELERCVKEHGYVGALVNSFTQKDKPDTALYYDLPEYRPFWKKVSELDVPFYIHPRAPLLSKAPEYEGHPWLMSSPWGFAADTAVHSLRLCGSGLFKEYPNLKIVIGHMGEGIPFFLWRIDARMRFSPRGYKGGDFLGETFVKHFWITTSGNFCTPSFQCALSMMGIDKILFSADYPFESNKDAAEWFDGLEIAAADKEKIGRTNAMKLFKLDVK